MNFYQQTYLVVKKIPRGKVMTYGQIAALISTPRAARAVGYALRALPADTNIPWQRVVNSQGMISIVNPHVTKQLQIRLLKKEGVSIKLKDGNYYVDLKKYLLLQK